MDITLLILGLFLVTFIPRVLPAIFASKIKFSKKLEKYLKLVTYTTLAALIFPGVLTVDMNYWYIGLIGALIATILAWKKLHIGLIIILTVISLIIIYMVIPYVTILF